MSKILDLLFFRRHHTCPRWLCFTFDNGIRRLFQRPAEIVKDYIQEGDRVLDVGPGIGFFTLPMAVIVGKGGMVIAADIQQEMLAAIGKRAERAGLQDRIRLHLGRLDLDEIGGKVDFILAFWMVHEVLDKRAFLEDLYAVLKDGGKFLMVEPKMHVTRDQFDVTVETATGAGFEVISRPGISGSIAALFSKSGRKGGEALHPSAEGSP